MEVPLKVTAHALTLSDAVEAEIREKVAKLETSYGRITSCHIVVGAPVRTAHDKQGLYNVSIDLSVPGAEIVVTRKADPALSVALRDAFHAARRQLEDYGRRQRGDVKTRELLPHAVVKRLFPQDGYGFLETPEGREVYFHQNSVMPPSFAHLAVGTEVRFAEEEGEEGPQASTVHLVGKS